MATRVCKHCKEWGTDLIRCPWCGIWCCRHEMSEVPWPDQGKTQLVCDRCCDESD